MDALSRRRLLSLAGRAAALAWASRGMAWLAPEAAQAAAARTTNATSARTAGSPAPELIERNAWPEHWETTLAALDAGGLDTPNRAFFVRSHFPVPPVDPATWQLE